MSEVEERRIERLLVVRLSAMGDVIHTLPAAQALREAFPQATIGWLIEERWAELLCAPGAQRRGTLSAERPLVDWLHTVDLKGWRKSPFSVHNLEGMARVWNDIRGARYEVVADLQGAIRSAVLAQCAGTPVVYGARMPREGPATLWYTRQVTAQGAHVIEQNVSIVEALAGKRLNIPRVKFPRHCVAEEKVDEQLRRAQIGEFAILNPGAGWGAKQWPAERYGEVARALSKCGLRSIVNCGPEEERLAHETEAASQGAALSYTGSLSELIALTRRAQLFIGGDTGPLHLAAALQIPVVAIFGPTDPKRNGPYGTRSVVLRNPESRTTHARNSHPDHSLLSISVEAVVHAARSLLSGKTVEAGRG